jgi:hypothetical protein
MDVVAISRFREVEIRVGTSETLRRMSETYAIEGLTAMQAAISRHANYAPPLVASPGIAGAVTA